MIRFNRRSWLLSIRANELSDIDPKLLPAALALQAAVIADGLTDQPLWVGDDSGARGRRAHRRAARLSRPDPRRSAGTHARKRPVAGPAPLVRRLSPG
jgi:hypothetical protein